MQYVVASDIGREVQAFDRLFEYLIEDGFGEKPYLDFGISNGQEDRHLNLGLIEQNEGFDARASVHGFYTVDLTK